MKWKPGTTVFEKDDWALVQQRSSAQGTRRVHHHKEIRHNTVEKDTDFCVCGEKVPDEIQGLWIIANWERLSGRD